MCVFDLFSVQHDAYVNTPLVLIIPIQYYSDALQANTPRHDNLQLTISIGCRFQGLNTMFLDKE